MSSLQEAKRRMENAIEALRRDFSAVRTGKATPALLDTVRVEFTVTEDSAFDVWTLARQYPVLTPGIDAYYGALEYWYRLVKALSE